jgi:hypothetical protein
MAQLQAATKLLKAAGEAGPLRWERVAMLGRAAPYHACPAGPCVGSVHHVLTA